jgi:hypothetical protein
MVDKKKKPVKKPVKKPIDEIGEKDHRPPTHPGGNG